MGRAGRWVAGTTLLVAAVYELTPLKDVCLGKCRSPLGFLLGAWRDGRRGALRMGVRHGTWCVGCCWALMASLFALGLMSLAWMAFVLGLIAVEKVLPWRRVATYGTGAVLLVLGVLMLAAPDADDSRLDVRDGLACASLRVLVIGAAGMLGRKLAHRLAIGGLDGGQVSELTLADVVEADGCVAADISVPGVAGSLIASRPDVIFQLAAVVSGEAESDFGKGYRVNLDGMRLLLEAVRACGNGYVPRLVFSSSIAVFGPPFPDVIPDDHIATPRTSYGTQKAIGELLLSDYSRRGFVDGVAVRLPTICVRPGAPNKAASGFFSSIIREPLNGHETVLPVPDDVRHWFASPRSGVGFLVHAAMLSADVLGDGRCVTMPGVSATVAEEIHALRAVGGEEAARLIRREPDETIMRIVGGWPRAFDARRAHELGFRAESSFEEIVHAHVEDEPVTA